jgi:hypothetical protein
LNQNKRGTLKKIESRSVGDEQSPSTRQNAVALQPKAGQQPEPDAGPTTQQLAFITAQLLHRHNGDTASAASEAIEVWGACVKAIELAKEGAHLSQSAESIDSGPDVTFDGLLRRLMPSARPVDRVKLFKDYLSAASGMDRLQAADLIARYRNQRFPALQAARIVQQFAVWWNIRISKVRQISGRKGQEARVGGGKSVDTQQSP